VALVVALMRKNMTQDVAAAFFGVSQPTVSRRWDLLRPLIGEVLSKFVPDPRKVIGKGTALVDGTVCPTWDWSAIPDLFSGKTGYPGMNIQIATDLDGAVAAISATAFNNQLSLIRAAVERAVAHVKTWRMLSEEGGRYRAHRQIRQHAQGNHRAVLLQQGL
jgi:hypothetical protein